MKWLGRLFRKSKQDAQLDSELRFHIEQQTAANIAAGLSAAEARRRAFAQFGGLESRKEEAREARGTQFIESLLQDIRFAFRMLRKSPGFTAVAILTLALGIGATTAIFSVVNAVLLKSLPYRDASRLVFVQERIPKFFANPMRVSAPDISVMQRQNHVFDSLAAYRTRQFNFSGAGQPQRIFVGEISAALFPTLEANPMLGRGFLPQEEPPGHNVAILSNGFWERQFGGDPQIIGKTISLDALPYTVVGVMPPGFEFPPRGMPGDVANALWIPIGFTRDELSDIGDNFDNGIVAKLKAGVTLAQARADMQVVASDVLKTWGAQVAGMGITLEAPVTPLSEMVVKPVRSLLYLLLAAVGFLLLIACANVANLLLSRAAARQKEITVRAALGARRTRIVRQLITESVVLALLGCAFGLLFAVAGTKALAAYAPDNIPQVQGITVDGTVLIFALIISVVTGVLFGLAPAFAATSVDLHDALKETGRSGGSGRKTVSARNSFVVSQVAIAFILVVGGGLLICSFIQAEDAGAGVQPQNTVTATIALPIARYSKSADVDSFLQQIFSKVRNTPGVESVGASTDLPTEMGWDHIFTVENHPAPSSAEAPASAHSLILGNYFQALGVSLVAGRLFTPTEELGKSNVLIISAGMAKRYWPGESALGKRIKWGPAISKSPWTTIVGVVGDVKQSALDEPTMAHTYAPFLQDCSARDSAAFAVCRTLNIAIRSRIGSAETAAALRSAVASLDSSEPVTRVRTLTQVLQSSIAPREFNTFLLGVFGCAALFLAAIGLYSVLAYRVTQQTHEIGIRVALGAQRSDILRGVLAGGAKLLLLGLVIGAAAALALTRLMQSLLYDVSATDPLTFVAVAVLLTVIALLACYIPARRAMRVDPMVALRYE